MGIGMGLGKDIARFDGCKRWHRGALLGLPVGPSSAAVKLSTPCPRRCANRHLLIMHKDKGRVELGQNLGTSHLFP